MRDQLQQLLTDYINEVGHFGDEGYHDYASVVLNELKENLGLINEDTKDSCMKVITEFQDNKPEHKELLTDFLTYLKYRK